MGKRRVGARKSIGPKLDRLAGGAAPRVLDLFAGCGGISLGLDRAGFEILGGAEKDPRAAWAYSANLHRSEPEERREHLAKERDVRDFRPHDLVRELGFEEPRSKVDVIVGGAPCQAYARVGRAKLRQVMKKVNAYRKDSRGELFREYFRYIEALRPVAVLIENVPDILCYGKRNIALEVAEGLAQLGYVVNLDLLNAADYGVPQTRRRLFLLAFARELGVTPSFPPPTHSAEGLPPGYREFSSLVSQLRAEGAFAKAYAGDRGFGEDVDLPPPVSVKEAIGDLPCLTAHLNSGMRTGPRRFDNELPYSKVSLSGFSREMRLGWPGFEGGEGVSDHVIRFLPRDFRIFAAMKPGDQYPQAHEIAMKLFEQEIAQRRSFGAEIRVNSREWRSLKKAFVPPYDVGKFPNKWRKLDPGGPSRTLMAHLSHDSYSHIHYDDAQARTISVREAARLQSFPDGFQFYEAMNPAFRMIGNAVPPLLAYQLGRQVLGQLREATRKT